MSTPNLVLEFPLFAPEVSREAAKITEIFDYPTGREVTAAQILGAIQQTMNEPFRLQDRTNLMLEYPTTDRSVENWINSLGVDPLTRIDLYWKFTPFFAGLEPRPDGSYLVKFSLTP